MIINDTKYREVARYLATNPDVILEAKNYNTLTQHINRKFGTNTQPATISTLVAGMHGLYDYIKGL